MINEIIVLFGRVKPARSKKKKSSKTADDHEVAVTVN